MRPLTARQQEILALIQRHIVQTGFPPTRAEIAQQLGFRSANAAEEHLQALARKGMLELSSGTSRGIRLRTPPDDSGGQAPSGLAEAARMALSLPLIGRVAAGHPILAQEHIDAHYALDPSLFQRRPDYLLKVRGLSMRDAGILDGDLLAVHRTAEVRNGQIAVVRLGEEVTVKRWQRNGHRIELLPENPDFQPIIIDGSTDAFTVEGIGVGLIRAGQLS